MWRIERETSRQSPKQLAGVFRMAVSCFHRERKRPRAAGEGGLAVWHIRFQASRARSTSTWQAPIL
jgi:hypothetical protein